MGDAGRFFDKKEFSCKCGCGFNQISPRLVMLLDNIRETIGEPLLILSGCRCQKYNMNVGGVANSSHTIGVAVDIKATNSQLRYKLIKAAFEQGFNRIGIHQSFIHLDVATKLPSEVVWVYGEK